MNQQNYKTGYFKFIIGWLGCLLIRLIPFRPPNIEPILATIMPFSSKYKYKTSFAFGFLSIIIFDVISGKIGVWTLITGGAYGLLGIGACIFFKKQEYSLINYVKYSVIGTIVYDILTGLSVGILIFKQTFIETVISQIPFTAMHLTGNVIFALTLSPILYRLVVENKNLETNIVWEKLMQIT